MMLPLAIFEKEEKKIECKFYFSDKTGSKRTRALELDFYFSN